MAAPSSEVVYVRCTISPGMQYIDSENSSSDTYVAIAPKLRGSHRVTVWLSHTACVIAALHIRTFMNDIYTFTCTALP